MTKAEVIKEFCKLSGIVMRHHNCHKAADCFCEESHVPAFDFRFEVLPFIVEAVNEMIAREKSSKVTTVCEPYAQEESK